MLTLGSTRTAGGGVVQPSTTPQPVEPDDLAPSAATKSLVNKPTLQPLDPGSAGGSTQSPLPLAPTTAQPSGGTTRDPAVAPTDSGGSTSSAPAGQTAPTPYQTNDPLAFMPMPAPAPETAQDLTPSIVPTSVDPTTAPATTPTTAPTTTGYTPIEGGIPDTFGGQPTQTQPISVPDPILIDGGGYGGAGQGGAPAASALTPTTASNGTVSLTPTTPDNSLSNYTIGVGPTANRFGIAQDLLDQWDASSQPEETRQLQTLSQQAAGRGQTGSGMARGSFADLGRTYNQQRTTAQRGFLDDALNGSIEDAYKNVGIAQQQQTNQQGQQQTGFNNQVTVQQLQDSEAGQAWTQQFQAAGFNATQIQQAFANAMAAQKLSDDETGQTFNQAMQQYLVGQSGSPQDILQYLAGLYALPQGYTGTATA